MSFIAAGTAFVGTVATGYLQGRAADKAAAGSQAAADYATSEQARQYDQTRQDLMPWMDAGTQALGQQQNFLAGDWSGFENSPDYAFAVDQGFKGLNRGAAAQGNFGSGGADADRIALGQGLATQYAGNYYNRLAGLSGTGQQTANQLGGYGANYAGNAGNIAMGNAANQRQSTYDKANAWGNVAGQLGQLGGYVAGGWQQGRAQNAGTNAMNNFGWGGLGSIGY